MTKQLLKDFDLFSRALIGSKDVDPVYPLVKHMLTLDEFKEVEPEWFIFCYVGFYCLESGIKMVRLMPKRSDWDSSQFREFRTKVRKFGHERRGTARNVDRQIEMFEAIVGFLDDLEKHKIGEMNSPLIDSNLDFRDGIESLPNHGGWASFKIAELFEKSLGYSQFKIPDLGLEGRNPNSNDNAVGGLRWLFGREIKYDKSIYKNWNEFGFNLAKGWGVDIGEVETCLCKFHKLKTGKYFIGHDIQEFVELKNVLGEKSYKKLLSGIFDKVFWENKTKLEKSKKSVYRDKNIILYSEFANKFPRLKIVEEMLKVL